jgi:hypothetical protein
VAYQLIRELSQRRNQKVAVIAHSILEPAGREPAAARAGEDRVARRAT